MQKLNWPTRTLLLGALCAAACIASPAQVTFTSLASFDGSNGAAPVGSLVQGLDGNFYGTTENGGINSDACFGLGCGTVFKVTPTGTITTLYRFCAQSDCSDGTSPTAGLVLGTDGNFYGTTAYGGVNSESCYASSCGSIFKIDAQGNLTTLYLFCSETKCTDGANPYAELVLGTDGSFYGTTSSGGAHNRNACFGTGCGTVFKITAEGTLSTLYSFCSQTRCSDGIIPAAGLVLGTDGNFYGTTFFGGDHSSGTVFKITPAGILTTLYHFCASTECDDGGNPAATLAQGTDGNFYGTTRSGGTAGAGTIFMITPDGKLTRFHSFHALLGGLMLGTDSNFYGPSVLSVFDIAATAGTLTTLHTLCTPPNWPDGCYVTGLMQATDGSFYGTTALGGTNRDCGHDGCGTVFNLSVGLAPFVKTLPTSGRVGRPVRILGTNLSDAASVTFNGTAATFTVISASEIRTALPAGATTGAVQVTTPSGTLSSNVPFQVRP